MQWAAITALRDLILRSFGFRESIVRSDRHIGIENRINALDAFQEKPRYFYRGNFSIPNFRTKAGNGGFNVLGVHFFAAGSIVSAGTTPSTSTSKSFRKSR